MALPSRLFLICALGAAVSAASATEEIRFVLQGGRSLPISAVSLQGDKFVVATPVDTFVGGQAIPMTSVDHVFGTKPPAINQAVVLLLSDKSKEAQKLLEPIVAGQRLTAKVAGNFWLEAARAMLITYALNGQAKECTDIGKEISDATPEPGVDPFVTLGKALLMPPSTKLDDRVAALGDLTTDNLPADICAYASYFRGQYYKKEKHNPQALEAYLDVSCRFPSGGLMITAVSELQAADLLAAQSRREEAVALIHSVASDGAGTSLVEEANKRLQTLK